MCAYEIFVINLFYAFEIFVHYLCSSFGYVLSLKRVSAGDFQRFI